MADPHNPSAGAVLPPHVGRMHAGWGPGEGVPHRADGPPGRHHRVVGGSGEQKRAGDHHGHREKKTCSRAFVSESGISYS